MRRSAKSAACCTIALAFAMAATVTAPMLLCPLQKKTSPMRRSVSVTESPAEDARVRLKGVVSSAAAGKTMRHASDSSLDPEYTFPSTHVALMVVPAVAAHPHTGAGLFRWITA